MRRPGLACDAPSRGDQVRQSRVRRPRRRTGHPERGARRRRLRRAAGLLLGGEAGVGKTRLVEEFADAARRQGAVVALGGCVEIGADGLPFAPFSTALRALRRQLPGSWRTPPPGRRRSWPGCCPNWARAPRSPRRPARRGEHGPALRADRPPAGARGRPAHRRPRPGGPALGRRSTRHLIAYLVRTLRTGRLVVLATYRSDDIHRRHPLRPLLAELDRLRTVRRIELGRFTRDEVGRQIAGILALRTRPAPGRRDLRTLRRQRLLRRGTRRRRPRGLLHRPHRLPAGPAPGPRRGPAGERPAGRPDRRRGRFHRRVPAARRRRLLAEDDLIEALRAAVGANILLPAPDGDGYRFRHSLVREAVADDLLPGERSRLNRRYAEALDADPTLVPAAERVMRLASYWYHAHDPARALPAVLDASVEARRRHAYSEQLRLLERAMELWDSVPDEVRATLRPVDYTEVYPPCGCDPATAPLRYLDLMARPPSPAVCAGSGTRPEDHQAGAAPAGGGAGGGRGHAASGRTRSAPPGSGRSAPCWSRPRDAATAGGSWASPRNWCAACRPPRCTPRCWPWPRTGRCSTTRVRTRSSPPNGPSSTRAWSAPPTSSSTPGSRWAA
ncbi:AAA family ATPase [Streptomyces parvulus]|nr:AAA family ATPase [Streptomyces parvulus]